MTTTTAANAEQLANAVYNIIEQDCEFFAQPDDVEVIKLHNGWSLRIFDDAHEQAPHGLSWWMDAPEERGVDSGGWEILPGDEIANEAAALAAALLRGFGQ